MAKCLLVDFCENPARSVRPLDGFVQVNLGLSSIAAVLKQKGHDVDAIVLSRLFPEDNRSILAERIAMFHPDIIGLSAMSATFPYAERCACDIRQWAPSSTIIVGGTHVTLCPDAGTGGAFDVVCVGEGEYPMAELADAVTSGGVMPATPNLWIRRSNGLWDKTPPREFNQNLDKLPMVDVGLWRGAMVEDWLGVPVEQYVVLAGRGCPFLCTFCCNHALRKVAAGKYVRLRSPGSILAEVAFVKHRYPGVERIYLEIETIAADDQWLGELCTALRHFNKTLARPITYSANFRVVPGQKLDSVFSLLSGAHFTRVNIGVESGSERVRREIMRRHYGNQDVIDAVTVARKYGIRVRLNNMIGLPGETYADHLETVRLNQLCHPYAANRVIFDPYFGTDLYEMCKQLGVLETANPEGGGRRLARLDLPGFSRRQIQFACDVFWMKMGYCPSSVGFALSKVLDGLCWRFWDYWIVRIVYRGILRIVNRL